MVNGISKRNNQANLWVDKEFLNWLKKLKAKKQIEGTEIANLGELTREILQTDAIKEVEKQILNNQNSNRNVIDIKLRLDKKRLF